MLTINMFSSADKVAGQGVGSAYLELLQLLKKNNKETLDIQVNTFRKADLSHYHTIDFHYFLSTFFTKMGRKIGYVHFLPETLDGSIRLPKFAFLIFKYYVKAFYKRMDHLVVVNPEFKEKLITLGFPEKDITFIPNFVSKTAFFEETKESKQETRQKWHIPEGKRIVLSAGQIQQRKGVDDFATLAQRFPEIQFIWAGGFSFGKITDGYEKYKKLMENPPANLLFTGMLDREEMRSLYNIADLFALLSYTELMPMCILEAASCHTPILVRNLSLYKQIFYENCLAATDITTFSHTLQTFITQENIQEEYQEKARNISNMYSEEELSNIWENFYQEQANTTR